MLISELSNSTQDTQCDEEGACAQVDELQRVRLQLEAQVDSLAARLQDADARNAALQVRSSIACASHAHADPMHQFVSMHNVD